MVTGAIISYGLTLISQHISIFRVKYLVSRLQSSLFMVQFINTYWISFVYHDNNFFFIFGLPYDNVIKHDHVMPCSIGKS